MLRKKTAALDARSFVNILSSKCICCGICVEDCPVSAIDWKLGSAKIHNNRCVRCGLCIDRCPVHAIKAMIR